MSKDYLKGNVIDGEKLLNYLGVKLNKEGDLSEREWSILFSLKTWYIDKDFCDILYTEVEDSKVIYTCGMFFNYFLFGCKNEKEERIFKKLEEWWVEQ